VGEHEHAETAAGASGDRLGVLLVCFAEPKAAARAHRPLAARLRVRGDEVLDIVVLTVDEKHRPRVYDPRRVVAGTVTAAVTWGLFGLLTGGGVNGLVSSAIIGAVFGGLGGYLMEHVLSKGELARIGTRLPAPSSAVLVFAETDEPAGLLAEAAGQAPAVASAIAITDDLTAREVAGPSGPGAPLPGQAALLSMIVVRYPEPETAAQVVARVATGSAQAKDSLQVESIASADRDGRRHVSDPTHGSVAMAKGNVVSWGVLGLVIGAITGATGGGGVLGFVGGALATGVAYALFGAAAGALYGLWAGRAVSARRLKGIGPLLPAGTSMLLAWAEGAAGQETIGSLSAPGSQTLVLRFNPVSGGAVLDAT
jgi:uncharacterized membrane protein